MFMAYKWVDGLDGVKCSAVYIQCESARGKAPESSVLQRSEDSMMALTDAGREIVRHHPHLCQRSEYAVLYSKTTGEAWPRISGEGRATENEPVGSGAATAADQG